MTQDTIEGKKTASDIVSEPGTAAPIVLCPRPLNPRPTEGAEIRVTSPIRLRSAGQVRLMLAMENIMTDHAYARREVS